MRSRIIGAIWFLLCSIALMLLAASITSAQPAQHQVWPYENWDGAYEVILPLPTTCPPLSTDMPLDVLIGYVGCDSIARTLGNARAETFRRTLTWSDTMRQALKYVYKMTDYDPIRLFMWTRWIANGTVPYSIDPGKLRWDLFARVRTVCPDTERTSMLCYSDIIARVRVTDTRTKLDSNAPPGSLQRTMLVTCTIVDPIKGKRIPTCSIDARAHRSDAPSVASDPVARSMGSQPALVGSCLQFQVPPGWPRRVRNSNKTMSYSRAEDSTLDGGFAGLPGPWVKPNNEYIIFLQLNGLGGDSLNDYATVVPYRVFGTTSCIYPIVNGKVYDLHDDFGFGTSLTVEQFIAALRSKIHSIINP